MQFFTQSALCLMLAFAGATSLPSAQKRSAPQRGQGQSEGLTPLMRASQRGQIMTVRRLLRKGVNVNEQDDYGRTALGLASYEGHVEVIKSLLAAGADPNARAFGFHAGEQSAP
jgi:ankyrin repeat protein